MNNKIIKMESKRVFLALIMSTLIFSCIKSKDKEVKKIQNKEIREVSLTDEDSNLLRLLDEDIDVQKIKSQLDNVTTTFLSKEGVIIYPDRKKNNFYGYYTLIKNDEGGTPTKRIGNMVVYDSINPYKYEKDTDEFVEITLEDKGVSLFDNNLEVGVTTYSSILRSFGDKYEVRDNTLIYTKGNKKAFFQMKDSIVSKLKIGIYRDNVSTDKILDKAKW